MISGKGASPKATCTSTKLAQSLSSMATHTSQAWPTPSLVICLSTHFHNTFALAAGAGRHLSAIEFIELGCQRPQPQMEAGL
eukprot:scaffold219425_cov12-Tisochrysis_lutea.AAC.1